MLGDARLDEATKIGGSFTLDQNLSLLPAESFDGGTGRPASRLSEGRRRA
jgi:hypothetical protein